MLSSLLSPTCTEASSSTYSGPPVKQTTPPPSSKGLVILEAKVRLVAGALMGSRKARTLQVTQLLLIVSQVLHAFLHPRQDEKV